MVLKCVRYLGQQGYGTADVVILTPYLGQLSLLVKTLSSENDPILNDLDYAELIRAGLMSPAGADISKRRIRISTIGKSHLSPIFACRQVYTAFVEPFYPRSNEQTHRFLRAARHADMTQTTIRANKAISLFHA